MQVWCLVDILKHPSASSITAYGGYQCDAHLEHLHDAQSGEPLSVDQNSFELLQNM